MVQELDKRQEKKLLARSIKLFMSFAHLSKNDGLVPGDTVCIFTGKYPTVTTIQLWGIS